MSVNTYVRHMGFVASDASCEMEEENLENQQIFPFSFYLLCLFHFFLN